MTGTYKRPNGDRVMWFRPSFSSKVNKDSTGQPLKDVVAHRAGTSNDGQAKVREAVHLVPGAIGAAWVPAASDLGGSSGCLDSVAERSTQLDAALDEAATSTTGPSAPGRLLVAGRFDPTVS